MKNNNSIARNEQRQEPVSVVSIQIRQVPRTDLQKIFKLIGNHLILAGFDTTNHLIIYARSLEGFSLIETVETYQTILADFHPRIDFVRAYLPVRSFALKGGLSC